MVCQTEIRCVCVCVCLALVFLPEDYSLTARWMFPSNTSWSLHMQSKRTTTEQSRMTTPTCVRTRSADSLLCFLKQQQQQRKHYNARQHVIMQSRLLCTWSPLTFVKVYKSLQSRWQKHFLIGDSRCATREAYFVDHISTLFPFQMMSLKALRNPDSIQ